jgi:hypothetical protein
MVTGVPMGQTSGVMLQVVNGEAEMGSQAASAASVVSDGQFRFGPLNPGHYRIEALQPVRAGQAGRTGTTQGFAAVSTVQVDGTDVSGLMVRVEPMASISGAVVIDESATLLSNVTTRVTMIPEEVVAGSWFARTSTVTTQTGRFIFPPVAPGRYRIRGEVLGSGAQPSPWQFDGATVHGVDGVDSLFEIRSGENIDDVALTFSARRSELTGKLIDHLGAPATGLAVLVFSTDRSKWYWESRYIAVQPLGADGAFQITGLPAGNYFVGVLTDIQPGEQFDDVFLDLTSGAAVVVRIEKGGKTIQNLRVGRQPFSGSASGVDRD